ncbi:hypothetical protein M378DRAFT_166442 [Amanita muscaria Koide BX008]|uniref:Uncharacterized protein n=1 Tax=Amanita muscaria (strain Koide BX008) TaxID=946122 RepID=A0A0C2WY88_AMAMK|nr:hypothetical protein M378DRAFT_166442 [Amanita muscaria Koide BX008]
MGWLLSDEEVQGAGLNQSAWPENQFCFEHIGVRCRQVPTSIPMMTQLIKQIPGRFTSLVFKRK